MRCSELLGISLKVWYGDTRKNVFRMIITATQARVGFCVPSLVGLALRLISYSADHDNSYVTRRT
jgi:hypothetical protein